MVFPRKALDGGLKVARLPGSERRGLGGSRRSALRSSSVAPGPALEAAHQAGWSIMHLWNPSPHVERPGVACFARADPAGRPSRWTHACLRAVAIPSQAQVNLGDFGPVLSGPAQAQQTLVGQVQHPAERCCRNPTARPRSATDRHLGSVQRPARARARSTCSGSRRGSRFPPERCSGCVASPDWWFRGKLSATSCCRYGHGGYLRGSYRIATAPDADSNRLTASSPHA
jgi:hypothetical protein